MKFFGTIGFATTKETAPSVFTEVVEEREYYGDVLKESRRWDSTEYLNDNLVVTNRFSIVSDGYLLDNLYEMRYLIWQGKKWKISTIEVERPRVILSIGGVYNGD